MYCKKVSKILLVAVSASILTSVPVHASQNHLEPTNVIFEEESEPLANLVPSKFRTSTFVVTGDDVRFRSAPGLSSTVLGILQRGEYLSVGTMNLENQVTKDGYVWLGCQRQLTRQYGWVAIDYVSDIGN